MRTLSPFALRGGAPFDATDNKDISDCVYLTISLIVAQSGTAVAVPLCIVKSLIETVYCATV